MGTRGSRRLVVLLALLAMVAAACGARVSEQQVQAAGSNAPAASEGSGGAATADGGDATAAAGEVAPAADGGSAPAATDPSATAPAAGGGQAAASTAAAPAGGNGGAVDVGVTATQVLLGNVSTMSGPVPGLFQGAVIGTQAVIAYQNSKGGLFGRKFKLEFRDDQFDTGQNRTVTRDLLNKVFAMVGSFSLYDDAAAADIAAAGIPDMSVYLNPARGAIKNNFAVAPSDGRGAPTGPFLYFKGKFPDAVKHMGTIYGDVPSAKASHERFKATAESVGWHYDYVRGFQATETDFTADVVRMKSSGVKGVYLVSTDDKTTARLAKAMAQQGFKPDFFVANYMPTLVALGGAAVENMYSASPYGMFQEDGGEAALFREWMQKVKPGSKPDLFAMYGWAQGRLLFQAMEAAGPKAKRADVLAALAKIPEFNANNLLAPAGPAAKRPATCYVVAQIKGGAYKRIDPAGQGFRCDGTYFRR